MKHPDEKTRLRIQFSTTQDIDSPYWAIAKYYQGQDVEKTKSLILEAASAYWMPIAVRVCGQKDEQAIREAALKSYYLLYWRIEELSCKYSLNDQTQKPGEHLAHKGDNPVTFDFGYRPKMNSDSELEFLLKYLFLDEVGLSSEKKLLWCSFAYWGDLACQKLTQISEEERKKVGANCVAYLKEHQQFLKEYLDFPFLMSNSRECSEKSEISDPGSRSSKQSETSKQVATSDKLSGEIDQQQLLNRPELDDIGLKMFGADQF